MDAQRFDALVNEVGLSHRLDELRSVRRPAVALLIDGAPTSRSRAGGAPDLPLDFVWPDAYLFTAQLDFEEIARACGGTDSEHFRSLGLPVAGLLSLFHSPEAEVKGWYHPRSTTLVSTGNPPTTALNIDFVPTFDVPANRYQWNLDASDAEWDAIAKLRQLLIPSSDHLLGYPTNFTLAYDPTPGTDWSLIFNVRSHQSLNWHWHDGDRLAVFCAREKLSVGDVSALVADAG